MRRCGVSASRWGRTCARRTRCSRAAWRGSAAGKGQTWWGEGRPEPTFVPQFGGGRGREGKDPPVDDAVVREVLNGVRDRRPEAEVVAAARKVDRAKLEAIIHAAEQEVFT